MSLSKDNAILDVSQKVKPFLQVKLSKFIEITEEEFAEFIKGVERDELFKKLSYPLKNFSSRVIRYHRYPHVEAKANIYKFIEGAVKDKSVPDIEELLLVYNDTVEIIKNIGEDKFRRYFLYNDFDLSISELARICQTTEEKVFRVIEMMDEFFIRSRLKRESTSAAQKVSYWLIASLRKVKGRIVVEFLDLNLARGLYKIDYERLKQLKKADFFSKEELKRLSLLIEKLTLINFRKTTVFRILSYIIRKQRAFLSTGESSKLIPLTQKESAKELGISLSLVSRVIRYKSVLAPWGEEFPLRFFFPNLKEVRISILKEIIDKEKFDNDQRIKEKLQKDYGIYISRRTISKYRKELKIPSLGRRR